MIIYNHFLGTQKTPLPLPWYGRPLISAFLRSSRDKFSMVFVCSCMPWKMKRMKKGDNLWKLNLGKHIGRVKRLENVAGISTTFSQLWPMSLNLSSVGHKVLLLTYNWRFYEHNYRSNVHLEEIVCRNWKIKHYCAKKCLLSHMLIVALELKFKHCHQRFWQRFRIVMIAMVMMMAVVMMAVMMMAVTMMTMMAMMTMGIAWEGAAHVFGIALDSDRNPFPSSDHPKVAGNIIS